MVIGNNQKLLAQLTYRVMLLCTLFSVAADSLAQDDDEAGDHGLDAAEQAEYDEPAPPEEVFDEPMMDEPPPIEEPIEEPRYDDPPPIEEPMDNQEPVDDFTEREPPPPPEDASGPRPDPNYGSDTGDSSMVPVDPETQKNRKVIRTVPRKEYSKAEVNAYCRQYEGQHISFYSDIFKVQNCVRRKIINNKTVYRLMRDGVKITTVSQDVIAALTEGDPLDRTLDQQSARSCKALEKDYVTFSNVDVYYVENCRKRLMPDWETYLEHRKNNSKAKTSLITSLSWPEFSALKDGEPIASIIDAAYGKLLDGFAGVDVIPVDEACRGLNGKIATYYSRLYKIEGCFKREITDPSVFFKASGGVGKFVELSSEQWLSLPEGEPINNDRDLSEPKAKG